MCGRFTITSDQQYLEERFKARFNDLYHPRFNAAPGQALPVITNDRPDQIQLFNWGIMPEWWRKMGKKSGLINIRTENLQEKRTFKNNLEKNRCLILADSFYEWEKVDGKKPYRILLKNEEPFAFAGLWEEDKLADGKTVNTFSIITTGSNKALSKIHSRMPVILSQKNEQDWLGQKDSKKLLACLKSYPANKMKMYEISKEVNNPGNDYPAIMEKI